jgi:hypothetical protein
MSQKEFGDFQTPLSLAIRVVEFVEQLFGVPDRLIEPTAGLGNFLQAASTQWGATCIYKGYEINPVYVAQAKQNFADSTIQIEQRDFFKTDWPQCLQRIRHQRTLILGNPPWITNAALGACESGNLPKKTNFQKLQGLEAKTGKSNFDIAEWMIIRLIEASSPEDAIAMLCKTTTARKVLHHFWKNGIGFTQAQLFRIDTGYYFKVAVDACLLFVTGKTAPSYAATTYSQLSLTSVEQRFGLLNNKLVADLDGYRKFQAIEGVCRYTWRSGVKHDAAKIMEFDCLDGKLANGFGEVVQLEADCLYPLLKSSDLGNGRCIPRKSVLITQRCIGEDTCWIQSQAPQTWAYLERYATLLNARKSSIYRNRPQYSIFGVGDYSFAAWKVAISGLYKSFRFVVIPPKNDRPVMIDDTCYAIACASEQEAILICNLLNSQPSQSFLAALTFDDAKRPITIDVLRRISLEAIACQLGCIKQLSSWLPSELVETDSQNLQLTLI